MIKALVVARREFQERSFVLLVAACLAIAPFTGVLIRRGDLADRLSAATMGTMILGAAFTVGLGILFGVSMIGRETREKRLSFYFARPLGAGAIWFGKLGAAILMIAVSAVIFFSSGFLFLGADYRGVWSLNVGFMLGVTVVVALAAMLVTHAVSTMIRARSVWIVADFVAAVVIAMIGAIAIFPLLLHGAVDLSVAVTIVFAVIALAGVAGAGARQLSQGRVDPKGQHRSLSVTLWSALAVAAAGVGGYSAWVQTVEPKDISGESRYMVATPAGKLATMVGPAKYRMDFMGAFVIDQRTGRYVRATALLDFAPAFSASGEAVAYLEPGLEDISRLMFSDGRRAEGEVIVTKIEGDGLKRIETGVRVPISSALALSHDSKRIALHTGELLTVIDLQSRASLGSVRLDSNRNWGNIDLQFLRSGIVRASAFSREGLARLRVVDFDPVTRQVKEVLSLNEDSSYVYAWSVDDGSRILVRNTLQPGRPGERSTRVFDATTGEQLFAMTSPGVWVGQVLALSDGRFLSYTVQQKSRIDSQAQLLVYSATGELQRTLDLGRFREVRLVGESSPGKVVVGVGNSSWTTIVFDIDGGTIVGRLAGASPVRYRWTPLVVSRVNPERIVARPDGIFVWNANTGATRPLVQ